MSWLMKETDFFLDMKVFISLSCGLRQSVCDYGALPDSTQPASARSGAPQGKRVTMAFEVIDVVLPAALVLERCGPAGCLRNNRVRKRLIAERSLRRNVSRVAEAAS